MSKRWPHLSGTEGLESRLQPVRFTTEARSSHGCSAGFQPAVSPISNRQTAQTPHSERPQAGSTAIQQVGNLRYGLVHSSAQLPIIAEKDWRISANLLCL